MSRESVADALDRAAEAIAQAAHELRGTTQSEAGASAPPAPAPAAPRQDTALGYCPVHGVPWAVQKGGISKRTNKPYKAFWKCKEKDGDNYCDEKPIPVWADTHPAEEPAPPQRQPQREDADDVPF